MSSLGSFLMPLKKLTISEACQMEKMIRLSWIEHHGYFTLLWRYILTTSYFIHVSTIVVHQFSILDGIGWENTAFNLHLVVSIFSVLNKTLLQNGAFSKHWWQYLLFPIWLKILSRVEWLKVLLKELILLLTSLWPAKRWIYAVAWSPSTPLWHHYDWG